MSDLNSDNDKRDREFQELKREKLRASIWSIEHTVIIKWMTLAILFIMAVEKWRM
jgi:hypothetical protein